MKEWVSKTAHVMMSMIDREAWKKAYEKKKLERNIRTALKILE